MSETFLGEYIIALDVGTTTLRCQIIGKNEQCIGSNFRKINLICPDELSAEIEPDELLASVIQCIREAVKDANILKTQLKSLVISTQRGTFITWSKSTGEYFHNFITWKDLRAEELTRELNKSWKMTGIRTGCYVLYLLSNIAKFGVVSNFKFTSGHVIPRLLWLAQNNKKVQQALKNINVMFGTLDTWLVYKLTGCGKYVTDVSNASATGMYDPFSHCWSFLSNYFNVPFIHLPTVVSNDDDFGMTVEGLFGVPIKIDAVMSDQSAAMYGLRCFKEGDLKLTLGTGAFFNLNFGEHIKLTASEVYPLVGWDQKSNHQHARQIIHLAEVGCSEVGSLIEWMLARGIISSFSELDAVMYSADTNSGYQFFSPSGGFQSVTWNNPSSSPMTIENSSPVEKEQMIRAVLESIVFRVVCTYEKIHSNCLINGSPPRCLRVNGGVAKNDFICQYLADLLGLTIRRTKEEMSTLGVTYMAGIKCGFWRSHDDICKLPRDEDVFNPTKDDDILQVLKARLEKWRPIK